MGGRGTGRRKALGKKDTNVAVKVEVKPLADADVEEEAEDLEEQLRIVNLVCHAVDQEVESRSAAIVAIGDGHMASATTQLQLLISRFPEHIRKMSMKKFLKEHCPNTKVNTRPDGTLCFDLVQDSAAFTIGGLQPPGGGFLNLNSLNFNTGIASVRNTPGFANVRNTPGFASLQNTPGFGPSQTMKEYIGEGVSNQLAGQKKDIEQLSWDEFLAAYRMQSAMKGPSAWDTPSLRTPGMSWRDTMITQNYTPMIEKVYPSMLPSQTGNTLVGGTKRKAPTSRGLRM
ncbi:hypothetical protein M758_3G048000 [Ceratodon purpureus]|nr:hypothetical protein M758_3G048000 [Ceratodon purpureus]